jgi:hypothetical protein
VLVLRENKIITEKEKKNSCFHATFFFKYTHS